MHTVHTQYCDLFICNILELNSLKCILSHTQDNSVITLLYRGATVALRYTQCERSGDSYRIICFLLLLLGSQYVRGSQYSVLG